MDSKKTSKSDGLFRAFVVCLILAILCLVSALIVVAAGNNNSQAGFVLLVTTLVLGLLATIFYLLSNKASLQEMVDEGQAASIEAARALVAHRREAASARYKKSQQEQMTERQSRIDAAQHPQCPACHGHNTQRISTTKRVVSTSLVGLASSTIGKQYECLDCQHKW